MGATPKTPWILWLFELPHDGLMAYLVLLVWAWSGLPLFWVHVYAIWAFFFWWFFFGPGFAPMVGCCLALVTLGLGLPWCYGCLLRPVLLWVFFDWAIFIGLSPLRCSVFIFWVDLNRLSIRLGQFLVGAFGSGVFFNAKKSL
jgi:hypothetical protein